jgi:hypothetical protein
MFVQVYWKRRTGYCLKDSGIHTNSRYRLQFQDELDHNWHLIDAGAVESPKD